MGIETAKLREYLLRNLPEKETEEIDCQIISGERLEEELFRAEDELMEDYLEGTLSPGEVELFHQNFHISDVRKSELRHIRLLKKYAQERALRMEPEVSPSRSSASLYKRFYAFLKGNLRPVTAVFALMVLGFAVVTGWRIFIYSGGTTERTSLEREFNDLNRKDLSDLSGYQNLSMAALGPGTFRDSTAVINLSASELTDRILFRLVLPGDVDPQRRFNVTLVQGEDVIFSVNEVPPYGNKGGKELRLILPSSVLRKGEYRIRIAQENSSGTGIDYPFNVR